MKWLTDGKLAVSMAASWAWGASLVVGISVMLGKGMEAWLLWTVFNILAVPVFAIGYHKLKDLKHAPEFKAYSWPMMVVQVFAVWMNLQAIYEISAGKIALDIPGLMSDQTAMIAVMSLAVIILALIYVFEFTGSLVSDQFQFWVQVGLLLVICSIGFAAGSFTMPEMQSTSADVAWGWWVGIGLIAGPYMDAMQWERIERAKNRVRVGILAGLAFGFYLLLVGLAATVLTQGTLVVLLLLLTSLMVDSSTLDSATSAKQYLMRKNGLNKNAAALLSLGAIATWPLINSWGAVMLQTVYASFRLFVWVSMLLFFGFVFRAVRARIAAATT